MPAPAPDELGKIALSLVATDRQLATATAQAIRRWAATKKATARTHRALLFAEAIDRSIAKTTAERSA